MKRMRMKWLFGLTTVVALSLLGSCIHPARVYHQSRTVNVRGWFGEDTLLFALDSLASGRYSMNVEVRYTADYPFQDLWLVVQHNLVDSAHWMVDTLHCQLVDERGSIQGVGLSGLYQLQIPFKEIEVRKGGATPLVRLNHCMSGLLKGVSDIGLSLER